MKRITFALIALFIAAAFMSYEILSHDGVAGYSGGPGEFNCTTCHGDHVVNTGTGSVTISVPTMPGWLFTHGYTYTVNVTVAQTGDSLFGFSFEAIDSSGANAGTLVITDAAQTQIKTFTVSGNVRKYVVHTGSGNNTANSHTFTFNWTAPTSHIDTVKFYAAGLAANGDGTFNGDYTYTTKQVLLRNPSGINEINAACINMSVIPNPVSDNCIINYILSSNSFVSIKLIDVNGQVVKSFVDRNEATGKQNHTFHFDKSTAKGIYFISVEVNGMKHFQKIVVG